MVRRHHTPILLVRSTNDRSPDSFDEAAARAIALASGEAKMDA
jgi:hypothetical protein